MVRKIFGPYRTGPITDRRSAHPCLVQDDFFSAKMQSYFIWPSSDIFCSLISDHFSGSQFGYDFKTNNILNILIEMSLLSQSLIFELRPVSNMDGKQHKCSSLDFLAYIHHFCVSFPFRSFQKELNSLKTLSDWLRAN